MGLHVNSGVRAGNRCGNCDMCRREVYRARENCVIDIPIPRDKSKIAVCDAKMEAALLDGFPRRKYSPHCSGNR